MNIALRVAGFSIMVTFVSCGVGAQAQAQGLDTRIGKVAMQTCGIAQHSTQRTPYAL